MIQERRDQSNLDRRTVLARMLFAPRQFRSKVRRQVDRPLFDLVA